MGYVHYFSSVLIISNEYVIVLHLFIVRRLIMNRKEWLECTNREVKWHWYHECEKIRMSLEYNKDTNATHKHHLFDTPEQIEYNNTHYEMWGFNEDGTFEYGKYIIFVTPEEHSQIHASSDETNEKRRIAMKKKWDDENYRIFWLEQTMPSFTEDRLKQMSVNTKSQWADDAIRDKRVEGLKRSWLGDDGVLRRESLSDRQKSLWLDNEYRQRMSDMSKSLWENPEHRAIMSQKRSGENNGMYGKHHSDETKERLREINLGKHHSEDTKRKISESEKGKITSEETKAKQRASKLGEKNPMYGKHMSDSAKSRISEFNKNKVVSDETRRKASESNKATYKVISEMYREYKKSGGELKWNDFIKCIYNKNKSNHK